MFTQNTYASIRIQCKPGEQLEVDWAVPETAAISNRKSGETITMYVFVGVLAYSQYAYVEAFPSKTNGKTNKPIIGASKHH